MKQLILLALIADLSINGYSQTCSPPPCTYSTILSYNPGSGYVNSFNNAGGKNTTCFDGNGSLNQITNGMSLSGIQNLVFKKNAARYEIVTPLNMQNNMKVYVESGASLTVRQLSMNGGDTIFVKGNLEVLSVQNVNNSTPSNKAVIVMAPGSYVQINGVFYSPGGFYQSTGNATNQIHFISGCGVVLPVKFIDVQVKHVRQ